MEVGVSAFGRKREIVDQERRVFSGGRGTFSSAGTAFLFDSWREI